MTSESIFISATVSVSVSISISADWAYGRPCQAFVLGAVLKIERLDRRPSLLWSHLTLSSAVLASQTLGALPELAVRVPSASTEGVWTREMMNSALTTLTQILTAKVTSDVGSLDTLPGHGVASGFSKAEDERISQTLTSPKGPALRVAAAAWCLQRVSYDHTLRRHSFLNLP